ncbi:MAG: 23S rRNA (uracil(1939)-C(5))-methyltransferase RlmD [Clostridia bacterium]|nr:23S rRNA (uracil(1939)-C(5))-methyltransferase RlmD [Clostridia bacterium]
MGLKKNERIVLSVTDCTLAGSGVGHVDGMAVLTPATAVGDEITAHILKVKKTCAFAKAVEIRRASPDRIVPDCPAFPKCGGCLFRHITYAAELRLKENQVRENLRRIGHYTGPVEPIVPSPRVDGYRNKAQYPLSVQDGALQIGFYAPRSHRVIDCRGCRLQPASFKTVLDVFEEWINRYSVPVYDEQTKKGLLRHIYIRQGEHTKEMLVCAVATRAELPHADALCRALRDALPQLKTVVLNLNPDDTNVILGKTCVPLFGDGTIEDVLCGLRVRLSAPSFYQVNTLQAEALYRKAAELAAPDGETVLDLYCGAGTIGLSMADRAKEIIGVEIVPEAVDDAVHNAERNGIGNARFLCADAADAAAQLEKEGVRPAVVLLDPPRKGCAGELLETVFRLSPDRLVYISCDSATLSRDVDLLQKGGYAVRTAVPFDMFPRTGHVESVVKLTRAGL